MSLKSKAFSIGKGFFFQLQTVNYIVFPSKYSLSSQMHFLILLLPCFYALLEGIYWDALQLYRYGIANNMQTFKTGLEFAKKKNIARK